MAVSGLGLISLLSMTFLWIETQPQISDAPGGWQMNLIRVLTCQPRKLSADESGWLFSPLLLLKNMACTNDSVNTNSKVKTTRQLQQ